MTKAAPKRIDVDAERLRAIVQQARLRALTAEEHELLEALLETTLWLTDELRSERASAKRLYRMLFGPTSEKTNVVFTNEGEASEAEGDDQGEQDDQDEQDRGAATAGDQGSGDPDKRKGHGRQPAAAYHGADKIQVPHPSLKPGHSCPSCTKGKVYRMLRPKVAVRITGEAPLAATVHEAECYRCNLCGEVFPAPVPDEAKGPKYDASAAMMIAYIRFGHGFPHNRLAKMQHSRGVPVPASTQWKVIKDASTAPAWIYDALVELAAQGELFHNDDTKMPLLALTGKRRASEAPADDPDDRTGMFTTAIVSLVEGRRIALYFTGRRHAGENLDVVLSRRDAARDPPMLMCDGLSRNIPKGIATIVANCLSHGRRHFVDVADSFPQECEHVLVELGKVFHNDAHCRKEKLSAEERLAYHVERSAPIMTELKVWLEAQLREHLVEPNSTLGQAFGYMLKRWEPLTLFLRKAGAPIDNNLVERVLKRAIVHRKGSLFYRSLEGARIGDIYMSLIHTAELCSADPFDYLVALQRHAEAVRLAPAEWLPWNYGEARSRLLAAAAA